MVRTFQGFNGSTFKVRSSKRLPNAKGDQLEKQVMNVKKSLRKINNKEELKYLDTQINGSVINSTALITDLSNIPSGYSPLQRVGRDVSMTSIQFRAMFYPTATSINTDLVIRHIILINTQANAAATTQAMVLDTAAITNPVIAPYVRSQAKNIRILYDETLVLSPQMADPANAATEVLQKIEFRRLKRKVNRQIKFQSDATAIPNTNALVSLIVTNSGPSGLAYAGYRLIYKDD